MDRRSWLWRRKSSEKSPSAETESTGSISSLSERFSDDQLQALPNHHTQSPEVTSKTAPSDEELNETIKNLSAKLSEALINIREKEDLVKQHAKVAEEAVSGWEKAEAEVLVQKKQLETANQKNSILEERISHLDGALKECLRQLRQTREEQEQNVKEAVSKTNCEWESKRSELENDLAQLQSLLQSSKAEESKVQDLQHKLEYVEKQNSILQFKLVSISEELKLMTCERDLSTHAAETASKQHLESIKRVAKLEAECRMLKVLAQKKLLVNDNMSTAASSAYVESFDDSVSDNGERLSSVENDCCKMSGLKPTYYDQNNPDFLSSALVSELSQHKHRKPHLRNTIASSAEINLMDDFLEMEKLAARPDTVSESSDSRGYHSSELFEFRAITSQTIEVEKLAKIETEKLQLEMELNECKGELKIAKEQLEETKCSLVEVKTQLDWANEARRKLETDFKGTAAKLGDITKHLPRMEAEIEELKSQLSVANEAKKKTQSEVESANTKIKNLVERLEEAQIDVVELQAELAKANEARRAAEIEVEATNLNLNKSEFCLEETVVKLLELQTQLEIVKGMKFDVEAELIATYAKKDVAESQLRATEVQLQTLLSKVDSLQEELRKERVLNQETALKLQKLEISNSVIKSAPPFQKAAKPVEYKIDKDKHMKIAASRFADCQKTIASIGWQLKSLATMNSLLIDSDEPLEIQ